MTDPSRTGEAIADHLLRHGPFVAEYLRLVGGDFKGDVTYFWNKAHLVTIITDAIRKAQQEGFDAGCMHAMSDKMDGTTPGGVDKEKVLELLARAGNSIPRTSIVCLAEAIRLIVEGMK